MVIVAGYLLVDPQSRTAYLAEAQPITEAARATEGCFEFSLSADLVDPERIVVLERWATRQAVEAFRGDGPSGNQSTTIRGGSVTEYDVAGARPLL